VGNWSKWCIPGVLDMEKLHVRVSGEVGCSRVGRAGTQEMACGQGLVGRGAVSGFAR